MQTYVVDLKCDVPRSFRTQKAADSVALNIGKKSKYWVCTQVKRNVTKKSNSLSMTSKKALLGTAKRRNKGKLNHVTYFHFDFVRNPR